MKMKGTNLSLPIIRTFSFRDKVYHHVMNYATDVVYLRERSSEKPTDLLKYDPNCNVWLPDGRLLGRFGVVDDKWVFKAPSITVVCKPLHFAEGLLDSEVITSKLFLGGEIEN